MGIVDPTKFVIGIVFAILGIAMLVVERGARGFGRRRQAGAMLLLGSAVFVARGFGYLDLL